ncbi:MAG: FtsX-like permease family protein [Metamycoplasmataceae bacterium]
MSKLFKEILKSFSKTKTLLIGLIVLIFLSSGVFTLLSDVNKNYINQFDDYKRISKIHDLTVDTEIAATGERPTNTYIPAESQEKIEYVSAESILDTKKAIRFPKNQIEIYKNEGYIKISKLSIVGSEGNHNYLKVKDLYRFMETNKIADSIDHNTGLVESRNFSSSSLQEYISPGVPIPTSHTLKATDKIANFKFSDSDIKLGDLVTIFPGSTSILGATDDRLTNIKGFFINASTHEATISQSKKETWEKQGLLITITPEQTARLLGFTKDNEGRGSIYKVDENLSQTGVFTIDPPSGFPRKWRFQRSINKTIIKTGFSINLNGTINSDINNNNINQFFLFDQNFVIPNSWIVLEKTTYEYERYYSKLNFDFSNNGSNNNKLWTKNYKDYINKVSQNIEDEDYLSKVSFWKKTQIIEIVENDKVTVIDPSETIRISQLISSNDLNRILVRKNSKINSPRSPSNSDLNRNSILWIERETGFISQSDIDLILMNPNSDTATKVRTILNNTNAKNERIQKIDNGAKSIAQEALYKEILTLVGDIKNIALRENITTSGFLNGVANTFHFVNVGNENKEIKLNNDILIKQNVGKLYNEETTKSLLFELSSKDDISSSQVPETYIFKILDVMFAGMSIDKNYINPIITFENYEYVPYNNALNKNSNKTLKKTNAKIVRMQDSFGNIIGITKQAPNSEESKGKFYLLKEKLVDGKKKWIADKPLNFNGSDEDFQKYILLKNLNFADTTASGIAIRIVGSNGWAKRNINYENKYSIPFQILIPNAEIIDNWQESNNFNAFRNRLINSLTSIVEPLISPINLEILISSTTTSFAKNGFSDVLSFPSKIENRKLQKTIFGIFYEGATHSENSFWNEFLDEILANIITSANSEINYLENQIENIDNLLKLMLGIELNLSSINKFIDPKELLIGLRKIITSIDIDETIINVWERFYDVEFDKYRVVGVGDILPIFLDNIDTGSLNAVFGFKAGLKHIISNVNFGKVISHIKENILDASSLELFGPILDQINGNFGIPNPNPNNDYINMNTGLNKIIDLIDLRAFSLNVANNSTIRSFWVNNIDGKDQEYKVNSLSISGIFASLLNSLGKNNDNDLELHNAMIELLNISSKTEFEGVFGIGLYQPVADPNKLDIRDLQSMLKSQTPKLNNLKSSLEQLSIDLIKPDFFLNPESVLGKYLTNYIFDFAGNISIQNKDIKKKVDTYLKFMNETEFINFDPNLIVSGSSALGGNIANPTQPNSLADKFINMINPNTRTSAGGLLDTVMTQVYNEFYNGNNPLQTRDMTAEILGFYSFWLKFSDLTLNSQNSRTTQQVINQVKFLVNKTLDKNSDIGRILNATSKSFVGAGMNYKILDGFSNVKDTALKLANLSEEILIANGLSREVIDYYFGNDGEKLKINNNTIALVSALSSIINVQNTLDLSRANLITEDFVKLFLLVDKDETNTMLTMGQRTLNTLAGTTNTIIESLGISSVILNPFSAVLNAPTLLWFTVNQGATSTLTDGNLSYIIRDKLYRFDSTENSVGIGYDGFKGLIDSLFGQEIYIDNPNDMDAFIALSLDKDYLEYLSNNTFKDSEIFGVNISEALLAGVGSFVETRTDDFQIVISDLGSYLVKINEAYLNANNKSVYDLTLNNAPKDSIEMQTLINSLDDKYKINVNGLEYLIIGTDSTVDYLYPVTDLNNIQVDTKSQAILYVNQMGFDRARESNANAVVHKYFLIVASPTISPVNLRDQINKYIYTSLTGLNNYDELSNQEKNNTTYKKAYLYNESNPFNPEIALRVQTIETLIEAINRANSFISMTLLLLIGLVTIFVIKRYISSRSKVLGILKAQGYKSIQIAISICTFALFVCFFGATFGYIAGHFLQLPMMHIFSNYWTLPIATTNFNLISLLVTVLMPLVGLILLTIITTLFLLRVKPTKLMNGSFQLNNSRAAGAIQKKFHSSNIKSKFTLSLTLNSIWKLLSLLLSLIFTVTIMSFSFASQNAFGNAVTKTYKNRNYNYKIDLITPTLEGGSITTLGKQDIHNLLYVPVGNPNEATTYLADYFAPGQNSVINPLLPNGIHPNGQPLYNDKHIVTKSSFDLVVNIGGIETNVWNSLFNSMPDSQKASVLGGSQSAAKWLEWSQGLTNYGQDNEANINDNGDKVPYFKYIIDHENPKESRFVYRNINETSNEYFHQEIIISGEVTNIREKYRKFLVEAYNKSLNYNNESPREDEPKFIKDYFLTFGSVVFNEEKNEKFSYANTIEKSDESFKPIINGYDKDSAYVQILDKRENNLLHLTSKIWNESQSKDIIPVIINHVVKDKRNLNIGSKLELTVLNTANRFTESIKQKLNNLGASLEPSKKTTWTFEVVGINETFINEEWTTSQEIINHITYLDELSHEGHETPFNGILSNEDSPRQANESLGLYSENGYWSANEKIDLFSENISTEQQEKNKNIFRELFYKVNPSATTIVNNSVFAKTLRMISDSNISHSQESNLIKLFLDIESNVQLSQVLNPGNEVIINKSLERFSEIYNSNNILGPSFKDIQSKNIESGFISNTTDSINSVSAVVIILSLLISVTILIMISSLIVNENERNIAIFSILGYNNREKSILFFSLYIPIIVLSILFSIPITMALITFFSGFVNTSILISLGISLRATDVLISTLFVSVIFGFSSLIAWFGLNRVKPIVLLKEGD